MTNSPKTSHWPSEGSNSGESSQKTTTNGRSRHVKPLDLCLEYGVFDGVDNSKTDDIALAIRKVEPKLRFS